MFPVTPQIVAFQMAEREEEARRYRLARLAGAATHNTESGLISRIRSYIRPSRPATTCTAACAQ